MPINEWSDSILIAKMNDEPSFSEDMDNLIRRIEKSADDVPDMVIDMAQVTYLNSTNIAQLLRLRKMAAAGGGRLRICSLADTVWSVFLITGLDKIFDFTDDVSTSLASLQMGL